MITFEHLVLSQESLELRDVKRLVIDALRALILDNSLDCFVE